MDDWDAPAEPRSPRHVASRSGPDEDALAEAAAALASATSPLLVVGGGVDRAGAWDAAVVLAELLNAPVWEAPAPERASFPQDHRLFQGTLPLGMKPLAAQLQGHDIVLVAGAPVFRYYPHIPGPILPEGTRLIHLTDDPDEAARAPAGDAIVGDVRDGLEQLADLLAGSVTALPDPPRRPPPRDALATDPISSAFAMRALADALPEDAVVVDEAASSRAQLFDQIRIARPASYYFTASGGLGFGVPAAVGMGLALPARPVVCVAGDGAFMFGMQAIWTAAQYQVPVVYVILNNRGYGILKAFADFQGTPGVPGLDLPGLDIAAIARGLGVDARCVASAADLPGAYREAFHSAATQRRPVLLDVMIDPEVGALFGEQDP
jgi:benzoylformate decarboxylase